MMKPSMNYIAAIHELLIWIAGSQHPVAYVIEHYIKKVMNMQVKGKKIKVGMAVCSSKKFSNKRVNFSQVTLSPSPILTNYELTIPTLLPLYLILACHGSEVGIVIW